VEKAVLWAMALHPDERPASMRIFREALLGTRDIPVPLANLPGAFETPTFTLFRTSAERVVGYAAIGLFLIGLVVTLLR
jgi:serine/threonine-protein kinase